MRLNVDDAGSARAAGAEFARTLTDTRSQDSAAALIEQQEQIRRATRRERA